MSCRKTRVHGTDRSHASAPAQQMRTGAGTAGTTLKSTAQITWGSALHTTTAASLAKTGMPCNSNVDAGRLLMPSRHFAASGSDV